VPASWCVLKNWPSQYETTCSFGVRFGFTIHFHVSGLHGFVGRFCRSVLGFASCVAVVVIIAP
jgi:hypothetical protein